ncbi:MAG: electron transfer flavoprotein subunit alpha/FixB family protein [Desulfosarcinaceae bacterium]
MEDYKNILVVGELDDSGVTATTAQVMRVGRTLAEESEQQIQLLFMGAEMQTAAEKGYAYGADKVFMAADPQLENYTTDSYLQVLTTFAQEMKPAVILFSHNQTGLDLAPRLAFRLKAGVMLDCVAYQMDKASNLLEQERPIFGGKAHARYQGLAEGPQISTVREGAVDPADCDEAGSGEVIAFPVALDAADLRTRLVKKEKDESQAQVLKLASAKTVVCGGRGVGKKEGMDLLMETAELLDGAIAGSRPAIDQGWVPGPLQVGQTGKKVSPRLYMAVGISGALQHMAGCANANTIVAINTDQEAPIFKMSHIGVVGDFQGVLDGFNDEVKNMKG